MERELICEEAEGAGMITKQLPVIVNAPEARKDVSEAGIAVKFGLTLGALNGALQPST